jgi:glycosyltransferase involved in cell wall biosynthesis
VTAIVTVPPRRDRRIPICYLAPWVDYGGADKGTIDWFRWLDRDRFVPMLVTTQPSENRRLNEIRRYAEEVWPLPQFLGGQHFPGCILDLLHSRDVRVLHLMNSRIGFDLLPDLASLPDPPYVVVQLHVEEPDRSGYVRYVTTRYGNLVDAFSVSSHHLARAVERYDVSPSKIRVIPTGVDADDEFNPSQVLPIEAVKPGSFNVLFPGRLTEQKDPRLMVEVIRRVVDVHGGVQVQVVGDGPMTADVRACVRERGLEGHFSFHPPSRELAPWYAACDALLMTSTFEGVPYVVYEAMAMELPVIAPALAGNVELMQDTGGLLIDPRDDVSAYARAVSGLIEDRGRGEMLGQAGRARVLEHFTLRHMGDLHCQLYEELLRSRRRAIRMQTDTSPEQLDALESRRPTKRPGRSKPEWQGLAHLSKRSIQGQPLVSVVVPCFNHGRYLPECVEAILDQNYEPIEVIVVDDASTEPDTINALQAIESRERVRVLRQLQNSGPSAARNRAIRPTAATSCLLIPTTACFRERSRALSSNCNRRATRSATYTPTVNTSGLVTITFNPRLSISHCSWLATTATRAR